MHKAIDGNPTPISGNLNELLDSGVGEELPIITKIVTNMGNKTFLLSMPMKQFFDRSLVANERGSDVNAVAQRPLNTPHAVKLAKYMLKGLISAAQKRREEVNQPISLALTELEELLGKQPYVAMQPLICNLRDVNPGLANIRGERITSSISGETVGYKVWLAQNQLFYVVDGQHRRKAMQLLFDFLNTAIQNRVLTSKGNLLMPLKGELTNNTIEALSEVVSTATAFSHVQIECHLGLDIYQERQLFHDLNNLGKKVEASLALQFDNSNPVNVFIKEVLIDDDNIMPWTIIEKDTSDWHDDIGAITRKDLVSINARLFLNKTNISGATPTQVDPKKEVVIQFWNSVTRISGLGMDKAKFNTIAAQPVVLKALAKLTYDFAFGKNADSESLHKLLTGISELDFSHKNHIWRYYQLTEQERNNLQLNDLTEFLPTDDEGYNRDIGNYDGMAKTMRFGAKHNDIFPILGDMIRWQLKLPNRHKKIVRQVIS